MADTERHQLWSSFLETWPPERIRAMTLEEYTNGEGTAQMAIEGIVAT